VTQAQGLQDPLHLSETLHTAAATAAAGARVIGGDQL
jgi:hypothetical protein